LFTALANSLRSLTTSPATAALQQAHRMAQRRLAAGGPSGPARQVEDDTGTADYLLPSDIDPAEVAFAIHAKLDADRGAQAGLGDDLLNVLERRAGGRVVCRVIISCGLVMVVTIWADDFFIHSSAKSAPVGDAETVAVPAVRW
jgi:hypothetical protein